MRERNRKNIIQKDYENGIGKHTTLYTNFKVSEKAKTLENNTKEKLMHIQEIMLDKKDQPQNILYYTTIFV